MTNLSLDEERKFIDNLGTYSIQGQKTPRKTLLLNYISAMESGEHNFWCRSEVIILCDYARRQLG
jgi:hypothetical protein